MPSPRTAVCIFVVTCLLSSGRMLVQSAHSREDAADNDRRSGARFLTLRDSLPRSGVIGYIGQPQDSIGYYYLAQYALAPMVLDYSADHPLVVGNFPNAPPRTLPSNLKLVRDFGNGLLLLANEDAR